MDKSEELNLFLTRADELIESKYIVADVKIVNLLKSIAASETLLAIFKNCLADFDVDAAKKKYLVKSEYLSNEKGEFIMPDSSKELLAFIFCILMEIDSKQIELSDFIKKYFYEDGSYSAGFSTFVNAMIKPFRNTVKAITESVIEGRLQDPIEALTEEEARRKREKEQKEREERLEKETSLKTYGESLSALRKILLADKLKIKESKLKPQAAEELTLVIDMLANVIESSDKDAITYAFVAYKYAIRAYRFTFRGRIKKVSKLIKDVLNGL